MKAISATIEGRIGKRVRREKIQEIVLRSLLALGALGIAIAAPNSVQLLKHVEKHMGKKDRLKRRIAQAVERLKMKGLVAAHSGNTCPIKLTQKGTRFAQSIELRTGFRVKKPEKWDERWRIIMFDVWERRRAIRDRLRTMLENVGFVHVQHSVWVYPYPCEELLVLLRTELRLGRGILYIVAEEIENDRELRKLFGLPLD